VRFGRLGDLVLTWPALAWLAGTQGPVDLVTGEAYAPMMHALPWTREVHGITGLPGLAGVREARGLADRLRQRGIGAVYDLHASLRSRVLCAALRGRVRRVSKQSTDRRLRVGLRLGNSRLRLGSGDVRPFTRRFLDTVGAPTDSDAVPRWPLASGPTGKDLALLPGARRPTKRWPAASYGVLARRWRERTGATARVFYGPGEEALVDSVVAEAGGAATPHRDLDLLSVLDAMAACAVAVGGDTGLLHLAASAGAAPVGLFGPTGAHMGYWPWRDRGVTLSPDLSCHPCTLYGAERCGLEHHACLAERTPDEVLDAALSLLGAR